MNNDDKLLSESQEEVLLFLQEARNDLLTFCQLIDKNFEATWFHEEIANALAKALYAVKRKEKARIILAIPPRHGKEILSSTPVPTPKGFVKHGDLKPGDYVFDKNGRPTRVLNVIPQPEPATLKVTFTDGASVVVHPNHEWTVKDRRRPGKMHTVETREMVDDIWIGQKGIRGSRARFLVPYTGPVQFDEQPLPMDPYTFGVWLGNGTTSCNKLITFNPETFEEMLSHIPYKPTWIYWHKTHNVPRARFADIPQFTKEKTIPDCFIFNSEENRRELLAGLIDTDGHVDKAGRVHFSNTSKPLIDKMKILVESLGYRVGIQIEEPRTTSSGIIGRKRVYKLNFSVHDKQQVAKLKYKQINTWAVRRMRGVCSIEEVAGGKGECITVDSPDGLYLVTENFIVTHNSQLASIYFPAWALGKFPETKFILSTYGASLSEKAGQASRDVMNSEKYQAIFPGVQLRQDTKAKARWMTKHGGSFLAVGVGGPVTGSGAEIILCDDILKDRAEAESQTMREAAWEYYRSTLYSRLEGFGAVVVIMQRWHCDDLVGKLLADSEEKKQKGEPYDEWEVINFPAIATEDEKFRKAGEPLWPNKFPLPVLENIRATQGMYNFASQYQQDPVLAEFQEFKETMFKTYEQKDIQGVFMRYYTIVDPAISQKQEADNTVVLTIGKEVYGPNIYRIREDAGHFTPKETMDLVFKHQAEYKSEVFIETVAYQKALKYNIEEEQRRRNRYFIINEIKTGTNKEIKIRGGLLPLYENGVIFHKHTDREYEHELLAFPRGKRDDRIDCMAMGVTSALQNTRAGRGAKQFRPKVKGYFDRS
jgi:hypothetical protein